MKLSQFAVITTLAGVTLGAAVDEVTCVFNRYRRRFDMPPFVISQKLIWSANQIATISYNSGYKMPVALGDRDVGARYRRFGYNYRYTSALSAYGYTNPRAYAEAVIRDVNIKHIGYAHIGGYTNVDMVTPMTSMSRLNILPVAENKN